MKLKEWLSLEDSSGVDYDKFIRKMENPKTKEMEWAFIDIHNPKKVFKYYGKHKPSVAEIKKELRAIEYFKNKGR